MLSSSTLPRGGEAAGRLRGTLRAALGGTRGLGRAAAGGARRALSAARIARVAAREHPDVATPATPRCSPPAGSCAARRSGAGNPTRMSSPRGPVPLAFLVPLVSSVEQRVVPLRRGDHRLGRDRRSGCSRVRTGAAADRGQEPARSAATPTDGAEGFRARSGSAQRPSCCTTARGGGRGGRR